MLYLIVLPKPGASGQHAAVHCEGAGQVGSGGQEHATADDQEEQGPASDLPAILTLDPTLTLTLALSLT